MNYVRVSNETRTNTDTPIMSEISFKRSVTKEGH